tara:strand:- start:833 stop:1309 length:477 start_codon:yes stop_codon:yes gene_type:complete
MCSMILVWRQGPYRFDVTAQFVGDHNARLTEPSNQLVQKTLCRSGISPRLNKEIQTLSVRVDGRRKPFKRGIQVTLFIGRRYRNSGAKTTWRYHYELSMVGPNGFGFSCPGLYVCDYSDALESVGSDGCYPVPKGLGLGVAYDHIRIKGSTLSNIAFK